MTLVRNTFTIALAMVAALVLGPSRTGLGAQASQVSKPFAGAKVNGGTVSHAVQYGKHVLTLSGDFQVPDTPDPHWQVVDAKGRVFLLQRLKIKGSLAGVAGDRVNMSITLPSYIENVTKVQIYCAWAEALLGEASFSSTVMTAAE
jgi:hypothetical protein